MDQGQIPQLIVSGITSGCIYAIVAVGFSVVYSSTGVINFAQGEFVMVGAMVGAAMLEKFSLAVTLPVAIAAGCLVGAFVAVCLLIPLRRATVITLIIVTVGASIMLRGLAQLLFGEDVKSVPPFTGVVVKTGGVGQIEDRTFELFGAFVRAQDLWVVGITALLVVGMHLFFKYTLVGQAMRACSMEAGGARLVGISVRKMIVVSFVMSAAIAAISGIAVAPISSARPEMGTFFGLKGFCAAVLGGLGNFGGGVVAGLVLGIVEALVGGLLWSDYRDAIAFIILVAILFIRPEGILSRKKAEA